MDFIVFDIVQTLKMPFLFCCYSLESYVTLVLILHPIIRKKLTKKTIGFPMKKRVDLGD